jgi:ribose transport system permease protein
MFVALVVMCLGLYISNPDFLGQSNVVNTTRQIAMLGIFGIGIAFVIITGGIDLSVGSIIGLTGVILSKVSSSAQGCWGYSFWIGIPIALGIAILIGLAQGLLITRLNLQPFIVTLGGMLLLRGISQTIVQGGTLSFGSSHFTDLSDSGLFMHHGDPLISYPVLIFVIVGILAAYLLHFTVFGRYVYAIGGNRDAAEYSGINVKRVETLAYVISAGLAGVAGICYAAYIGQMSQQVGIAYELYAIAGAVLGGCSLRGGEGTIIGVTIGSAIMRVIDNGINMFQYPLRMAIYWLSALSPRGLQGLKSLAGAGRSRIWRLDPNWNYIIIGGVILVAVILDQVAHIVQAGRRTRRVTPPPAPSQPGPTKVVSAGRV